ncbi:MAG: single-stranded DNA-binding protein [Bacilli bacterium]|nr:single-stranded DNA-binding protein [Bacilli bacterium]
MNNVILVGRLTSDPTLEEIDSDKKRTLIDLAVPRNFKNSEGLYESDFIRCVLWNGIALNTSKYCTKGDAIAVRGRIQTRSYEDLDGNRKYITEVIAQSISFVTPSRKEEQNEKTE